MTAATNADGAATGPRWLLPLVHGVSTFYLSLMVWLVAIVAFGALFLGLEPIAISSGSMEPRINVGDVVLVDPAPGELGPGAVVTFDDPVTTSDRLVTHRIEDVAPNGRFVTKGDANAVPDSTPVPRDAVEGAGRVLVPLVGRPVMWVQQGAWPKIAFWFLATAAAVFSIGARDDAARSRREGVMASIRRFAGSRDAPAAVIGSCALILLIAGTSAAWEDAASAFTGASPNPENRFDAAVLAAPTDVTASFDCGVLSVGKGVLVEWGAVSEADSYEVHRSTTSGGPYSLLATVDATSTSYKDTEVANDTTYHYVVRSVAGGWTSDLSAEASATTPSSTECLL